MSSGPAGIGKEQHHGVIVHLTQIRQQFSVTRVMVASGPQRRLIERRRGDAVDAAGQSQFRRQHDGIERRLTGSRIDFARFDGARFDAQLLLGTGTQAGYPLDRRLGLFRSFNL